MDLLHRLKTKYHHLVERRHVRAIKRKHFKMTVAEETILGVKSLAAVFKVPSYVVTEHLLQVGTYYVLTAFKDEDKRRVLEEHLVKTHLLGSELSDGEDILSLRTED